MGDEAKQAEPSDPTPKPASRALFTVFGVLGTGGVIGLCTLFYNQGKDNGLAQAERTKAEGLAEVVKCQRDAERVEADLRRCTEANAALQGVMRLAEADRNRLLEVTATTPPLRVTVDDRPPGGEVPAVFRPEMGPDSKCAVQKVWFENTGTRDLRLAGTEWFVEEPWFIENRDALMRSMEPAGQNRRRFWIETDATLAPGVRRVLDVLVCHPKEGGRVKVEMSNFTSEYLPLHFSWTVVPK